MKDESLIELKEKLKNGITKENDYKKGFEKGIDESFKLFSKYAKNYSKYYNNIKLLLKEDKRTWKKWIEFYDKQKNINKENYLNIYNKWLFDYFFNFSTENELKFEL